MYYHLSEDPDLTMLTPRVPRYAVGDWEDVKTERICFSDSISHCLTALQDAGRYYVYILANQEDNKYFYHPSKKQVRDVEYTHESWCMKEVPVICIGKIKAEYERYETVEIDETVDIGVWYFTYQWINHEWILDEKAYLLSETG